MGVSVVTLALAKRYADKHGGGSGSVVYYDTQAGWDEHPTLVSVKGGIYITKDYSTLTRPSGEVLDIPGIRIGDGVTLLKDLPYTNEGNDKDVAVSTEDVERWNNKVTAYVSSMDGENLILTNL